MKISRKKVSNIDSILVVGRPLQIIFKQEKNKFIYKSAIADFDSESIAIMPLTKGGRPAQLRKSEAIDVIYHGVDAMYQFVAKVIGHRKENSISLALLEKPVEFGRIQRREFFRLHLSLEGVYKKGLWKNNSKGDYFACYRNIHSCFLEDLSGGGLALHTKEKLEDNTFVKVKFIIPLEKNKKLTLEEIITIIREKKLSTIDKKDGYDFVYGTSFVDIDENKQADILRFIMWKQLEQRRSLRDME